MVKPFVPPEVAAKVHIASGEEESRVMMEIDIDRKDIPVEVGGEDEFTWDVEVYYGETDLTMEESMVYEKVMPWQGP